MNSAPLAVRANRLFDGRATRSGPVQIVVEDGRIVAVDLSGAAAPPGCQVDTYTYATVMPGLIDSHSHLAFDPVRPLDEQMREDSDATLRETILRHARQALQVGVTTVRDLGDRGFTSVAVRDETRAAAPPTVELVASGPPLTSPGGHCASLGGEVSGLTGVENAVRQHVDAGADLVKVMATGGMGADPARAQFSHAELCRVVDLAHELGVRVVAHAHATVGIRSAVIAGVDGIEHCSFMTHDGVRRDDELIDAIAAAEIFVGCTVARPRADMPRSVLATLEPYWATNAEMHRRGVNLVCCTDAGINPAKPHDILPGDLAYYASHVGTSIDALRSVTSVAAESCGLGTRKGHVAVGYDADLLVVGGNPWQSVADVQNVRAVYVRGQRVHHLLSQNA